MQTDTYMHIKEIEVNIILKRELSSFFPRILWDLLKIGASWSTCVLSTPWRSPHCGLGSMRDPFSKTKVGSNQRRYLILLSGLYTDPCMHAYPHVCTHLHKNIHTLCTHAYRNTSVFTIYFLMNQWNQFRTEVYTVYFLLWTLPLLALVLGCDVCLFHWANL